MSYIATPVGALDTRLDELATEITRLEDVRSTLQAAALATPPPAIADQVPATRPRRRRGPAQTTTSAKPSPPATRRTPELPTEAATGAKFAVSKSRRRAAVKPSQRKRSVSSASAEQVERLLTEAVSGLSAGAIAERAGVGYSRVLAHLRAMEASGKVRRTGNRRSTLWLLSTDEDWVAQRAAELERLIGVRRDDRTQRRGRARAS